MKAAVFHALVFAMCLVTHPALAEGGFLAGTPFARDDVSWKTIQRADTPAEVNVDIGRIPDERLRAFKGESVIDAPPLHIIAVMMDVDRFPEWVYQLDFVEREKHTNQPKHFYLAFKGMWPTKPRDVGVAGNIQHDLETGEINMLSFGTGDDIYAEREGYVRIPRLYNLWTLTPLANQQTKVVFTTFVDVGGGIPKWLVNMVSESAPERTIVGLRKQLATGRYDIQSAKELPFIPEGLYLK